MRPFATNLKKLRTDYGLSQSQAARMIGISRPALGSYEEDRAQPPYNTLVKICKAFRISNPLALISDTDAESEKQDDAVVLELKISKITEIISNV